MERKRKPLRNSQVEIRVNDDLEDSVGFEMNTKVVDEKYRLICGKDFVYRDEEKGAAQRGALKNWL